MRLKSTNFLELYLRYVLRYHILEPTEFVDCFIIAPYAVERAANKAPMAMSMLTWPTAALPAEVSGGETTTTMVPALQAASAQV